MSFDSKFKLLQQIYALSLVESNIKYSKYGFFEEVVSQKKKEGVLNAARSVERFHMKKIDDVFFNLSELFGCANWKIKEDMNEKFVIATSCMLCSFSKALNAPKPCNLNCLEPMKAMVQSLDFDANFEVLKTLWNDKECLVKLS